MAKPDWNRAGNVGELLARWLCVTRPTIEPQSYANYARHVEKYLIPRIGNLDTRELDTDAVEQLYIALVGASVSASEVRKIGTTLTVALGYAARRGLLAVNPAAGVKKPKASHTEMSVWTADECRRFLAVNRNTPLYALALDSGARQGELRALDWTDFDFAVGMVDIRRALVEEKGGFRLKPPKSRAGVRRVFLAPPTVAAILEHRGRQMAAGLMDAPVFCTAGGDTRHFRGAPGGYLFKGNLYKRFKAACRRAAVPEIRFHDLRHTAASLLLSAGVNILVVSRRLGHGDVSVTLKTYSHLMPDDSAQAAIKLGKVLYG